MKIPWIRLIIAGMVFLLVIAGVHHLSERLPPSKVNLVFKGWSNAGTNTYAVFDLTNLGPRSIYWDLDGAVIVDKASRWVTNHLEHFTYVTLGTPPGSNETVTVKIPKDATNWMIQLDYFSFQKRNIRLETIRKIVASGAIKNLSGFMGSFIGGVLYLFPNPKEEYHQIFSEVFTNKPADKAIDQEKSR